MTSPSAAPRPRTAVPRPWRAPAAARIASLMPFLVAAAVPLLAGPRLSAPMFAEPSVVAGLPLGILVGSLVLAWAAFGAVVVWTTHSRLAATLSLAFLSLPSIFGLLLGPAVILVLQNLP